MLAFFLHCTTYQYTSHCIGHCPLITKTDMSTSFVNTTPILVYSAQIYQREQTGCHLHTAQNLSFWIGRFYISFVDFVIQFSQTYAKATYIKIMYQKEIEPVFIDLWTDLLLYQTLNCHLILISPRYCANPLALDCPLSREIRKFALLRVTETDVKLAVANEYTPVKTPTLILKEMGYSKAMGGPYFPWGWMCVSFAICFCICIP